MIKYNNFDFQNFYKKYSNLDSEKLLKIMIKNILNIISSNVVIDIPYRKKIARKLIPESSSTKKY